MRWLNLHPFGPGQRSGKFFQRDVRFGADNINGKVEMRGPFAEPTGRPSLRLRGNISALTMLRRFAAKRTAVAALTPNTRPAARAGCPRPT